LPVVATAHSGIPEAVEEGRTGFLVPENDAEALAARLAELLESQSLRRDMGVAARGLAERKFDQRMLTERLEAIYDEVAGH
jgi:glycosyltransferase involved in cell wall biosynthesis